MLSSSMEHNTSRSKDNSTIRSGSKSGQYKQVVMATDANPHDAFKKKMQEKAEKDNNNLWQHPFVDVLKHFKLLPGSDWKLNKKTGDVEEYFVSIFIIFFSTLLFV